MNITLHHLQAGDAKLLENVAEEVFDDAIDPKRLSVYLAQPNQHLIVARASNQVVGQIRGVVFKHPDKPDELFIENLGVTPAYKRQKIATRLIQAMLELGKAEGCQEAWVATEDDNLEGKRFYASLGVPAVPVVMYTLDL
jgi:ribosomal protein S18 acetylase RimI-like enzyme